MTMETPAKKNVPLKVPAPTYSLLLRLNAEHRTGTESPIALVQTIVLSVVEACRARGIEVTPEDVPDLPQVLKDGLSLQ